MCSRRLESQHLKHGWPLSNPDFAMAGGMPISNFAHANALRQSCYDRGTGFEDCELRTLNPMQMPVQEPGLGVSDATLRSHLNAVRVFADPMPI